MQTLIIHHHFVYRLDGLQVIYAVNESFYDTYMSHYFDWDWSRYTLLKEKDGKDQM